MRRCKPHYIWFTAALLLFSCEASTARQSPPDFGEVEKVAIEELRQLNAPGAAIGIVSGDRLVYAKGVGISDVETAVPVSPEMLFRLGSTTKMFTAAALIEDVDGNAFIDFAGSLGCMNAGNSPAMEKQKPSGVEGFS